MAARQDHPSDGELSGQSSAGFRTHRETPPGPIAATENEDTDAVDISPMIGSPDDGMVLEAPECCGETG